MAESLEGQARIKFKLERVPSGDAPEPAAALAGLGELLLRMEKEGLCPVLEDGATGGNASYRGADGRVFVTASGRSPGARPDFAELLSFDPETWSAEYRAPAEHRPSSDSPLHWTLLHQGHLPPRVVLHGHALETPDEARALGIPISAAPTLFSTPEDRDALLRLVGAHPWPNHTRYIRRGHGFFLLAEDLHQAEDQLEALIRDLRGLESPAGTTSR